MDLLPRIARLWKEERNRILQTTSRIVSMLESEEITPGEHEPNENILKTGYEQLKKSFDPIHGGFGRAPKFPSPHNLLFLLRRWKNSGEEKTLEMVEKTLDKMRMGGIFDHLGYGYHRYSTDERWLVPHFEKMLYDQALLSMAHTEAFQATGKSRFKKTTEEILSYVLKDLTSQEGAFYASEDADSEGGEGRYYLWTLDELSNLLGKKDLELATGHFHIKREGNFREESTGDKTGGNILFTAEGSPEFIAGPDRDLESRSSKLEKIRRTLLARRRTRVRPARDEKILTDWNGLMIAALAKAGRAFQNSSYTGDARKAADFLWQKIMGKDGKLKHVFARGDASINGFIDDCAFYTWGLLELYHSLWDPLYLRRALDVQASCDRHFWDENSGGYYFTPDFSETLLARQKEFYDGAYPSGNAAAAYNLLRLERLTGNASFGKRAARLFRSLAPELRRNPLAHTHLLSGLGFALTEAEEIVITGDPDRDDTKRMLAMVQTAYLPHSTVLFVPAQEKNPLIHELAPFTRNMRPMDNKATAYICRNHTCQKPSTELQKLEQILNG
jgi:uncharacterized protein YyaL (SSP411 family)